MAIGIPPSGSATRQGRGWRRRAVEGTLDGVKRVLLLLICVALAAPAAAQARPFNTDEMRAVELAHDFWGRGPTCPQGITLEVVDPSAIPANLVGYATPCRIQLTSRGIKGFLAMCAIVGHEWGHLLGHGHSQTVGTVMYGSGSYSPSEQCQREDLRRARARCRKLRRKSKRRKCVKWVGADVIRVDPF